jgi:hypothetical protein
LRNDRSGPVVLEQEQPEGTSVGDLLIDLAPGFYNFRVAAFDADARYISEGAVIISTDRLLQFTISWKRG